MLSSLTYILPTVTKNAYFWGFFSKKVRFLYVFCKKKIFSKYLIEKPDIRVHRPKRNQISKLRQNFLSFSTKLREHLQINNVQKSIYVHIRYIQYLYRKQIMYLYSFPEKIVLYSEILHPSFISQEYLERTFFFAR